MNGGEIFQQQLNQLWWTGDQFVLILFLVTTVQTVFQFQWLQFINCNTLLLDFSSSYLLTYCILEPHQTNICCHGRPNCSWATGSTEAKQCSLCFRYSHFFCCIFFQQSLYTFADIRAISWVAFFIISISTSTQ